MSEREVGADAACVLKPLADVEADDVEETATMRSASETSSRKERF
jgi:hypothetical protein